MNTRSVALVALLLGLVVGTPSITLAQEVEPTLPTVIDWPAPVVTPGLLTRAVIPFLGGLVAVGHEQDGVTSRATAWWSADGTSWERTILDGPKGGYSEMRDAVVLPTGLVAMGPRGNEHCTGSGEAGVRCQPIPVAVWRSVDGQTWERIDAHGSIGRGSVVALAAGPLGVLAVGVDRHGVASTWRSTDGLAWEAATLTGDGFDRAEINDVAATPDGWVMVGSNGGRDLPPSAMLTPNGSAGAAWTSSDGVAWQPAAVEGTGEQVELLSVFVGSGGLTAIGDLDGGKDATMWSSVDGTAWTQLAGVQDGGYPIFPAASDGRVIIAWSGRSDDSGGVDWWASSDGVTWAPLASSGELRTQPVGPDSIAFLDGTLVVLAQSGEDELAWLARTSPAPSPLPSLVPVASAAVDVAATWGPLAVVDDPAIGGLDAGLGPGRLVIDNLCVYLQGRDPGSQTTLIWRSGQAQWDPDLRQIVYRDRDLGEIRMSDGDRMTLGGYGIGSADRPDNPEVPIGPWISEPDASCPADRFVAEQVVPEGR